MQVKKIIYGDILASDDINSSLKKWRGIFKVSQVDLARKMGISSSVISEYENNPNRTPGTKFIRKYVEALIEIDKGRGGQTVKLLGEADSTAFEDGILSLIEYDQPIPVTEYLDAIDAEVIVGRDRVPETKVYGHTVIDSVVAILSMSSEGFYRIYGRTTERVLLFTNVSLGRSPLVAIRVYPLKPRVVILHGPNKIDELGIKIAQKENLILGLSKISSINKLLQAINDVAKKYKSLLYK